MIARRPARLLRSRPRLTLGLALSLVACTTGDGRAPDALQLLERDALAAEPARGGALQLLPKGQNPSEGALQIAAPVSLTASDGTGLRIVSFQARAVVEDPLAFTELRLTFRNPQNRQIEGNFEITLPPGAAISRFAMRQGDHWQEGEVVELQAARQAYEDFLHRRQDPALMEKQAGNSFHARVFPIPANGDKELIVSFSQERGHSADPYRIFLRGLPQLDNLDLQVLLGKSGGGGAASSLGGSTVSHQMIEVKKQAFTPDLDFEVPVPAAADGRTGLRHENLAVARVTPVAKAQPDPITGLLVLFDTSASRALGFQGQIDRLQQLLGTLAQDPATAKAPLKVLCFDQDVEEVYSGPLRDFGQKARARILERRALGASDVTKALRVAAQQKGYPRALLVSDGVATAGTTDGPALRAAALGLAAAGVQRLDALTFGGIRDDAALAKLTTAGLARGGVVADGEQPVAALRTKLESATFSGIQVSVPGAGWVWPQQLDGLQPGDEVLVYADLPKDRPLSVTLAGPGVGNGATVTPAVVQVPRPLLERAWVQARIRRIEHQRDTLAAGDSDLREGLRRQIIELSTKHRVLSDYTALLVLETEADYQRFHIDRRALADILTVGQGGIEIVNRRQPLQVAQPVVVPTPPPEQPWWRGRNADKAKASEGAKADAAPEKPTREERSMAQSGKKMAAKDEAPRPMAKPAPMRNRADDGDFGGAADSSRPRRPMAEAKPAPMGGQGGGMMGGMAAGAAAAPAMGAPPPPPPPPPAMDRLSSRSESRRIAPAEQEIARAEPMAAPPRPSMARRPMPPQPGSMPIAGGPQGRALELASKTPPPAPPYEGKMLVVMNLLKEQKGGEALRAARSWRDQDPGDVLALVALGEVLESQGQRQQAARAYGSLIDLFPGRADLRRFAGERLERLGDKDRGSLELAIDDYRKAREQRPDHPASHRLLAFALVRAGLFAEALTVISEGAQRSYPPGRFAGVVRILQEDAGLIGAAWLAKEPNRRPEIEAKLAQLGVSLPTGPSMRFVLNWETDANDVDFHIEDSQGGHAYYGSRQLPSGGELYADVTTGYGPECFTIEGKPGAFPYRLKAHYYSRGPMGYGMGKLEIVEHDGRGGLRFQERPFVIMKDQAFVDLGTVPGPLK